MELNTLQRQRFRDDGVLLLPGVFSEAEIDEMRAAFAEVCAEHSQANIRERNSGAVRTAMGLHLRHPVFSKAVNDARLVGLARQLSGTSELYAQQVKINVKTAFEGEAWQWHYDFATHHREDGVPAPFALNLHIFLDEVTQFNGPLHFIAGSHLQAPQPTFLDTNSTSYDLWCVDRAVVTQLVNQGRLVSAVGKAGSVLLFGDLMVHSSPPNMSPFDRRIFSLILNPLSNAYTLQDRPDYKHHRSLTPVG